MTTVFIGGSRKITRLPHAVATRLDAIVHKRIPVLVGDANGADRAVQTYLRDAQHDRVTVYCTGDLCRNNVGGWLITHIQPDDPVRRKDRKFFTLKDRAMSFAATHGLMLWDAESLGTLVNIVRLHRQHRIAVVYLQPINAFLDVRTDDDLQALATHCSSTLWKEATQMVESESSTLASTSDATSLSLFSCAEVLNPTVA